MKKLFFIMVLLLSGLSQSYSQCAIDLNPQSPTCGQSNGGVDLSVFNATPPFSYMWNTGATTQDLSGLGPGLYKVTFTDAIGCSAIADTTLIATAPFGVPTASFTVTSNNLTTTFTNTSVGATSYQWNFGDSGTSIQTNPTHTYSTSGVYAVVLIATNSCGSNVFTQTVTISVPQTPTVTLTATPSTVACGSSTTLTWTSTNATTVIASGGWSGSKPTSGSFTTGPLTATTTFNITVTGNGGTATDNVVVNVLPVTATIVPNGPTTICQGQSVSLTANGGGTYQWSNGATTPTISIATSGNYIVTVSNGSGCTATVSQTVTVNQTPTGLSLLPITVTATSTYPVTITNASGCTATAQLPVTVNCIPAPPIHDTLTVFVDTCFGGNGNAIDADGDGYTLLLDCNDANPAINPGVTEICGNGVDEDCDGVAQSCSSPDNDNDGYTVAQGDCNDSNASVYPGAVEICDGMDNDCDGFIDEGVTASFYRDFDGDGYGNPVITTNSCFVPAGYVANNQDCNDSNANIHPNSVEISNNIDDNCNGQVDEGIEPPCTPVQILAQPEADIYVCESYDLPIPLTLVVPGGFFPNGGPNTVDWSPVYGDCDHCQDYWVDTDLMPGTQQTFTWVVNANTCPITGTVTIHIEDCSNPSDVEDRDEPGEVKVYPNPTPGNFTLDGPSGIYFLTDPLGKTIKLIKQQ